ncbi:MAG TPA: cyclase family protein [Chloroflexota bacterium]|nr:cyclase family protein [Chloroflexota bacterium]
MPERPIPTKAEVESYLRDRRNWGRWGTDDQVGAVNLITAEKRLRAASLVRSGRAVSLSREFPKTPALNNPTPAQHFMRLLDRGTGGAAIDYYGVSYHGQASTHLDSLCHVWNADGMWNGHNPDDEIGFEGARWGAVTNWSDGIITRGVLLDVPRFRGQPFVTQDRPIHGWELEDVAAAQGVALEPGDALVVYAGREAWDRVNPIWGSGPSRPGLHASCLPFVRDADASLLVWDMMDHAPNGYDLPWSVHGVIFAYGVGLVDNALLEPLANACAAEGRYEFMLMVLPLVVVGGTGSPANPVALF